MTAPTTAATRERVQARAMQWVNAELDRARKAFGPSWPAHVIWVTDYLRVELRERLAHWGIR